MLCWVLEFNEIVPGKSLKKPWIWCLWICRNQLIVKYYYEIFLLFDSPSLHHPGAWSELRLPGPQGQGYTLGRLEGAQGRMGLKVISNHIVQIPLKSKSKWIKDLFSYIFMQFNFNMRACSFFGNRWVLLWTASFSFIKEKSAYVKYLVLTG